MSIVYKGIFFFLSTFVPRTVNPPVGGSSSGEPDIAGKTFDYVIVGGGLTGLTVANRLSEDSTRNLLPPSNRDSPNRSLRLGPRH